MFLKRGQGAPRAWGRRDRPQRRPQCASSNKNANWFYLLWRSIEEAPVPQGFVPCGVFIHVIARIGRQSYLEDDDKSKKKNKETAAGGPPATKSRLVELDAIWVIHRVFLIYHFNIFPHNTQHSQCWCCQTCPQRPWCHSPADRPWSPSEDTCRRQRWWVGFRYVCNGPKTGSPERPTRSLSGRWYGCRSPGLERAEQRESIIKTVALKMLYCHEAE